MSEALEALRTALAGRYRVERELGRGGAATVYLAEDLKHRRPVALKVLRPEVAATFDAERFQREIGIAAQLSHPHIVPLIDSGEAAGLRYYVTAFVPGGSLRERLEHEGPLAVADAVRIAGEVGAALGFAHRQDVVHRDVKPENILFADGHAVLADFGIARACGGPPAAGGTAARAGTGAVTGAGLVVGTPDYMSPEQAAGSQDLTATSDVYSLGIVTYEMLVGEPPFRSPVPQQTMARHVTERPAPLRARRPDAPSGLERAVARALEKDPAARWPSVAAFVEALRQEAPPAPPAVTGLRTIAVLPFVNASPDQGTEYLSDGITDELINALAKVEGLRVAARASVFALKGRPLDVRAIGALLGASEVLEGTVRTAGDRLRITAQLSSTADGRLLWSERFDRTLDDVFAVQDEMARTIVATLRASSFPELALPVPKRYTENVTAYGHYLRGRYAWNRRSQEGTAEGIRWFEEAIAADPGYALAYTGLADSYALQVDYRSVPVAEGFERAKAYARQALALDDTLAEAHASLAWSLFIYDWDWEAAERSFRRAIALDPGYATAHQWYAFLLASQGRTEEGLVEAHMAAELDPGSVSVRRALGWQYFYARRFEQARYHLLRTIAMNPTAEESHRVLGLTLSHLEQHTEAVRVLREGLALPGAGTYSRSTLGYALARAGEREGAEAILVELEARAGEEYVSPVAFATLHLALGRHGTALDWAERALEERRGWLVYLTVNAVFDPLRAEPRYQALVRRLRL
jgi:serine/threonine-protein kinase